MSAPIRDRQGRVIAALNISGNAQRKNAKQMVKAFLEPLAGGGAARVGDGRAARTDDARLFARTNSALPSISPTDNAARMNDLDLNLIPYLVAIEETRNVSRAAERLGVSQPRVSTALGRLREYFNDPLFVRTSRGMEPTPRALALVPAAREALSRIERGLLDTQHFDPATTHRYLFDRAVRCRRDRVPAAPAAGASPTRRRMRICARCRCRTAMSSADSKPATSISRSAIFPTSRGNNFFQQRLFSHRFICLMRRDHPFATRTAHARAVHRVRPRGRARRRTQPGNS